MTPARLALLAVAALLATGGAFWLASQRQLGRAAVVGEPVLPQLRAAINEVDELRLSRGDGTVATLRRGDEGWTVVERGWPADSGKVRKLLLDLASLAIVEEKTHDPARYAVLGVEDVDGPAATGTRVDVKTTRGTIQSLVVGKPSGAREGFVRASGAAPSYLARPQVAAEPDPARWLDTTLLDIDASRILHVAAQGPGRRWRPLGEGEIPPGLAGALDGLALQDVRSRPLGDTATPGATGEPRRTRFTTREGLVIEVAGREDGGRRWITVDARIDPKAARAASGEARGEPSGDGPGAAPGEPPAPPRDASADPDAMAEAIRRRAGGHEFEVPAYRFATLFDTEPAPTPARRSGGPTGTGGG